MCNLPVDPGVGQADRDVLPEALQPPFDELAREHRSIATSAAMGFQAYFSLDPNMS